MRRGNKRIIAIALAVVLVVSLLSGCSTTRDDSNNSLPLSVTAIPTASESPSGVPNTVATPTGAVVQAGYAVYAQDAPLIVSDNWEDYIGHLDVFVYGLIASDLGNYFEVFPAAVTLQDGREVCGIGYTDFTECYVDESEKNGFVSAGFLSCVGDEVVTQEDFDSGLMIDNLAIPDESYSYLLAYRSSPFKDHCVVYGRYVVYGVDANGGIYYESEPYRRGTCDETIGALYSYDEGRFVFEPCIGSFVPLHADSVSEQLDFYALEKEINDIYELQNKNFVNVDTESCVHIAQEAVKGYLLSLQDETFLGYNVDELVELAESLDAHECFRITEDGLVVLTVTPIFRESKALMKWLIGAATGITFAVACIGALAAKECPVISAMCGSIAGTAVEIFMQVVIENKDVRDIDWSSVAVAAVSGAISGFLFPYFGDSEKVSFKVIDTLLDATIGGTERVIRAKLKGDDWDTAVDQFGNGFLISLGLSVGVKAFVKLVSKVPNVASGVRAKTSSTGTLSKLTGKINEKIVKLRKIFDASPFHSEHLAKRRLAGQVTKSVNILSGNISDVNGNRITKSQLAEIAMKAKDGDVVGTVLIDGIKREIRVWNKTVATDFAKDAIDSVNIKIVNSRPENFENAAQEFLSKYRTHPEMMPVEIKNILLANGYGVDTISNSDFVKLIQKSEYVFHECADLTTVMLIPRDLHSTFRHAGGYSVAKTMEILQAKLCFGELCDIAVSFAW